MKITNRVKENVLSLIILLKGNESLVITSKYI